MRGRRGDAGARLVAALRAALADRPVRLLVEEEKSALWRSITFAGARHRLRLRIEGAGDSAAAAGDALLGRFAELDFTLAGHLLADISATRVERAPESGKVAIDLEALTVEASPVSRLAT